MLYHQYEPQSSNSVKWHHHFQRFEHNQIYCLPLLNLYAKNVVKQNVSNYAQLVCGGPNLTLFTVLWGFLRLCWHRGWHRFVEMSMKEPYWKNTVLALKFKLYVQRLFCTVIFFAIVFHFKLVEEWCYYTTNIHLSECRVICCCQIADFRMSATICRGNSEPEFRLLRWVAFYFGRPFQILGAPKIEKKCWNRSWSYS